MDRISIENLYKLSPIYVESHILIPFQTPTLPPQQQNNPESEPEHNKDMALKMQSANTAKGWH